MSPNIEQYMRCKDMTPEVFALINVLVTLGDGIGVRYFDKENILNETLNGGYVLIRDEQVYLTKKTQLFLETLFLLAKEEGLM